MWGGGVGGSPQDIKNVIGLRIDEKVVNRCCRVLCFVPVLRGRVWYQCCGGVFGMFAVIKGRRLFSSVFTITERRDMCLYEVPLSMSFLGLGMGHM